MKKGQYEQKEYRLNNTGIKTIQHKQLVKQLQILVKSYNQAIES